MEGTGQRQATWAVILGSQSVSGPPPHAAWPGQRAQGGREGIDTALLLTAGRLVDGDPSHLRIYPVGTQLGLGLGRQPLLGHLCC